MSHSVYMDGRLVPAEQATVSVFDRSFLYGDGLFETLKVAHGRPFRWALHWARFHRGLTCLRMVCPRSEAEILEGIGRLVHANHARDGVLRLTLSRGVGARGYSPRSATSPTLVMTLSAGESAAPAEPRRWSLHTARFVLPPANALSEFKHANKLPQILARMEADDAGADEALVVSPEGFVAEGTSCSVFWFDRDGLCAPPLDLGGLPGVSRTVVVELCARLGIPFREARVRPAELAGAPGVILSTSTQGVVEGASLDGRPLPSDPRTRQLWSAYHELVARETANGA
jgi:branched-subunit amino acid aminotransferase/4-amino-4-deoxychorismate lyase